MWKKLPPGMKDAFQRVEESMIRALLRLTLVVIVVLAAIAFFMGYRLGDGGINRPGEAVGTTGATPQVFSSVRSRLTM